LLAQWQAEDRARAETVEIMQHYHQIQLADFAAAIRDDRPPVVTGEDGRAAVALFSAIYRSQATGLPVQFPGSSQDL
jgi:predicted dehydrogenase